MHKNGVTTIIVPVIKQNKTSRLTGISIRKDGRVQVRVYYKRESYHLGYVKSIEEGLALQKEKETYINLLFDLYMSKIISKETLREELKGK